MFIAAEESAWFILATAHVFVMLCSCARRIQTTNFDDDFTTHPGMMSSAIENHAVAQRKHGPVIKLPVALRVHTEGELHGIACRSHLRPRQETTGRSRGALLRRPAFISRVVYVRTTLGATPSGTGVPDLRRADPRQGISRRSCMLMRRILLKVGRGVRRRISQLGSCLHTPGADQSSVKHSVFNAFLLSHDSSNQLHHSMFCDRGFLTWSRSEQRQAFRVQCVSTIGTAPTNLYESLLLLS